MMLLYFLIPFSLEIFQGKWKLSWSVSKVNKTLIPWKKFQLPAVKWIGVTVFSEELQAGKCENEILRGSALFLCLGELNVLSTRAEWSGDENSCSYIEIGQTEVVQSSWITALTLQTDPCGGTKRFLKCTFQGGLPLHQLHLVCEAGTQFS